MSCARTRGVTPRTAICIPNGQRTNGACLPWCPPRVCVHPTDGASNFVHASHGVLHGYVRCYIPLDLKMRKIQPTRVLVRDGFGHNWTAVSSNPDETGVKRTPSTRSSVLRGTKNGQTLKYPITKRIFDNKMPPGANASTQKLQNKLKNGRRPMLAHRCMK